MSDRYLQWVIPGEQPDYELVEPVGTLTVRSNATSHIDNLLDVPPGKYLIVPVTPREVDGSGYSRAGEADDE